MRVMRPRCRQTESRRSFVLHRQPILPERLPPLPPYSGEHLTSRSVTPCVSAGSGHHTPHGAAVPRVRRSHTRATAERPASREAPHASRLARPARHRDAQSHRPRATRSRLAGKRRAAPRHQGVGKPRQPPSLGGDGRKPETTFSPRGLRRERASTRATQTAPRRRGQHSARGPRSHRGVEPPVRSGTYLSTRQGGAERGAARSEMLRPRSHRPRT